MRLSSLKNPRPFDRRSTASTNLLWEYRIETEVMSSRSASSVAARIFPSLNEPSRSRPSTPRPHRRQNAAPVGAITGLLKLHSGWIGDGPTSRVPGQFDPDPEPLSPPPGTRLISSSHVGPFSVCHSTLVWGSKVKPNEFRCPNEKIRDPGKGLPETALPPGLIRRT